MNDSKLYWTLSYFGFYSYQMYFNFYSCWNSNPIGSTSSNSNLTRSNSNPIGITSSAVRLKMCATTVRIKVKGNDQEKEEEKW